MRKTCKNSEVKAYQVQFLLPCENPVDNIVKKVRGKTLFFDVPINLPDLHNVGFAYLIEHAKVAEKSALSTDLNKKKKIDKASSST
jgi:hypothetical protein